MEKYHIYDEIGKGDFSQVFKGREKKKIEYVAIKRVDKSVMNKIVNEVQTMHRLESPHTIRFHDWYETKNNLWLILEYCTGSDLRSLLMQDGHLPETSVRLFAVDIMAALAYLHSNGLIHCDLRPANMLIDEYGILKLSDFKFVRKIPRAPEDADIRLAQSVPSASLGYMSPECLSLAAVPSFSSDFWSVGCILYQLRRGYMPFGAVQESGGPIGALGPSGAKQICTAIQRTEQVFTRPDPSVVSGIDYDKVPAVSAEFADLVGWLLEKNPLHRVDWQAVHNHPFWAPKVCSRPISLPPQPAFDSYLKQLQAEEIAHEASYYEMKYEDSISETPASRNLPSSAAKQSKQVDDHAENSEGFPSMIEKQEYSRAGPEKTASARSVPPDDGERRPAEMAAIKLLSTKDLLFCTHDSQVRPIVNNKAIEIIERPPFKASSLPCAPISIQQVPNILPTELEVHLTKIYKALHKAMVGCVANCTNTAGSSNGASQSPGANPSVSASQAQQQQVQIHTERINSLLGYLCSLAPSPEIANVVMNTQFLSVLLRIMLLVVTRHKFLNNSAATGGTPNVRITGQSPAIKSSSVMPGKAAAIANIQTSISATVTESACLAATALALMLRHATYVQPVQSADANGTPDRRGGRVLSSPNSPASQRGTDLSTAPNVVTALIAAMEVVDMDIANAQNQASSHSSTNGAHTPNKQTVSSFNRTARSPGTTGNASTSPAGTAQLDGILKLKLRLTAALGELAFYVSAQDTAPIDGGHPCPLWHLPVDVWNILIGAINSTAAGKYSARSNIKSSDDITEITKHYATKTIENILTTGGGDILFSSGAISTDERFGSPVGKRAPPNSTLFPQVLGIALLETSQHGSCESLQVSSAMAFGHLLRYLLESCVQSARGSTTMQQQTLARMIKGGVDSGLLLQCVHGLKDAIVKLQHAYLNVINVILFYAVIPDADFSGSGAVRKVLEPWRTLLCDAKTPLLVMVPALMEQSSSTVVRAKALLCIQLLDASCRSSGSNRVLRTLGDNRRFISAVARCLEAADGHGDNSFAQHSLSLLGSPAVPKDNGGGHSVSQLYIGQCAYSFSTHVQKVVLRSLESVDAALRRAADSLRVAEGDEPSVMASRLQNMIAEACKQTERIFHNFDSVRACVAVSSSPQLLRLVLCDAPVLESIGAVVKAIKPVQLAYYQFMRVWKHTGIDVALSAHSVSLVESFGEMLVTAEQVALSVLEAVAQLEVHVEAMTSLAALAFSTVGRTPRSTASADVKEPSAVLATYGALLNSVLPAALQLLREPSTGDVRVLVAVCLRRLLPSLVSSISSLFPGELFHAVLYHVTGKTFATSDGSSSGRNMARGVVHLVVEVMKSLPHLLSDKAPVPQYAVRLIADLVLTSYSIGMLICVEVKSDFQICGGEFAKGLARTVGAKQGGIIAHLPHRRPLLIDIVSRMLPAVAGVLYCPIEDGIIATAMEADEENPGTQTDPQAGVLLRMLVERSSSSAANTFFMHLNSIGVVMLDGSFEAVRGANDAFMSCLLNGGLCWALREAICWSIVQGNGDHLSILLDLLQHYLERTITRTSVEPTTANKPDESITVFLSQRNLAAEYLIPLSGWLAGVVSGFVNSHSNRMHQMRALEHVSAGRNWSSLARMFMDQEAGASIDKNNLHLIQEGCVACLTLLSELSPAHFVKVLAISYSTVSALVTRGRMLCSDSTYHDVSSLNADHLPPLLCVSVAETISTVQADIKVRIRYMKMLIASCKTCSSFGGLEHDLYAAVMSSNSDLNAAILSCVKDVPGGGSIPSTGSAKEEDTALYVSFHRLASNFVVFLESYAPTLGHNMRV